MNFYTTKDFRITQNDIWSELAANGEIVITDNNKPTALMLDIAGENLEEILGAIRQAKTMRAINKLQLNSVRNGLDKMTPEEINAEIKAAREA